MIRSQNESAAMLNVLRRQLRLNGWTARKLAAQFSIGEATAKRWLNGRGLTLERLEALASLCGMTLAALAREAEQPDPGLARQLTLAQERALSTDIFLSFLFMTLLGGATAEEIAEDFDVPSQQMDAALQKLERLALVDRLPGGRVRPLIDRAIVWRKSPMRSLFELYMKPEFMTMNFAAAEAVYASELMKLSAQGASTLAEMIEQHRRDVQAMAERDRTETNLPRTWCIMFCAARELDTSRLQQGV
jgi:transcriptional regulator with XRE-family HTH domain